MGALKRPHHHIKSEVAQGGASGAETTRRHCSTNHPHPPIGGVGWWSGGGGATKTRRTEVEHNEALEALAQRVARLAPSHRNPHAFHEDKSEIVAELRKLAKGKAHG